MKGSREPRGVPSDGRENLLAVIVEDYFQVAPLRSVVATEQWNHFESRLERNTLKALDLLDEFGIQATFFVLGWIADEMPEVISEVVRRGHEVASKGYYHRSIRQMDASEFRDDLLRSREALERAAGRRVLGYRIAHGWFGPEDLWALDVLAEEGFAYDSSVRPLFRRFANEPWRRLPHLHRNGRAELCEFPLSTWSVAGWSVPISGGNYLRQLPSSLVRRAIRRWVSAKEAPLALYFHIWELDPDQPRIQAAPIHEKIRQYRNLDKMEAIVRHYLKIYTFQGFADYLGLEREALAPAANNGSSEVGAPAARSPSGRARHPEPRSMPRTPATVVVPCYNEEHALPFLANTLASVESSLGDYELEFVFVDDGSDDGTAAVLERLFGDHANATVVRHERNLGVGAAILTGLRTAKTEIVCSIDCDCTYDPHQLQTMLPRLTDGVDMVTASPYHRDGQVRNVPSSRLLLSKTLSHLHRWVLPTKLATYSSCFRVYRKQAVADLPVREGGFLGVVEMLALLDLRGGKIVEQPTVLQCRLLGRSKMKTLAAIAGHLKLLTRLVGARLRPATGVPAQATPSRGEAPQRSSPTAIRPIAPEARLKIAFIGGRGVLGTYSGIETYYEEVGSRLVHRGHEVTAYCRKHFTPDREEYEGIRIRRLPSVRSKHLETMSHSLLATMEVLFRRYDIVQYHAIGSAVLSFLPRLTGKATVVSVRGLDWQRAKWNAWARAFLRFGEWSSARFPTATAVVSETLRRYYQDEHHRKTFCIPNAVIPGTFRAIERIEQYGLARDEFLLFAGRISPEKGVHTLLEALRPLPRSKKLAIAGGTSYSDDYIERVKELAWEDVVFLGQVDHETMEELYSNCYAFILPSDLEGLSIALLESLSYGNCIIATGIPENLEVLGSAGLTFQPGDVAGLRQCLSQILEDPDLVRLHRTRASERARSRPDWDEVARLTEALYFELLATGRLRGARVHQSGNP